MLEESKRRSSWTTTFRRRKSNQSEGNATRNISGLDLSAAAGKTNILSSKFSGDGCCYSSDDDDSAWVKILAEQPASSLPKTVLDDSGGGASSTPTPTPLTSSTRTHSSSTTSAAATAPPRSPRRTSTRGMLQSESLSSAARENIEELTTLHFGRQLQGRSHEIRQLKAAYRRVGMDRKQAAAAASVDIDDDDNNNTNKNMTTNKGRPELILISGASGTGKSVLARELKHYFPGNCFNGKFDLQLDPNEQHSVNSAESKTQEPFSAVLDAFEQLCAHLFSNLRFAHDQIEAAAADLLPWETAWQWKAALAKAMLLSKYTSDPKWLYVIADLCNEGHSHNLVMGDIEVHERIIDVNHRAGVKAMESCAYAAAIQYLEVALSLLEDRQQGDQFQINLHVLAAHAGYCSGDFRSMKTHLDAVLKESSNVTFAAKLPAYVTLVLSHIAQTQWNESIKVGLDVLRQLGFKLPEKATAPRILFELARTKVLMRSRSFDDLCNLPLLHDDTAIYTERIFDALATATYTMKSDFFALLTLLHVQMCIKRGVGTYSPVAFATYGIIVGAKLGSLKEGYRMGAHVEPSPEQSVHDRALFG